MYSFPSPKKFEIIGNKKIRINSMSKFPNFANSSELHNDRYGKDF